MWHLLLQGPLFRIIFLFLIYSEIYWTQGGPVMSAESSRMSRGLHPCWKGTSAYKKSSSVALAGVTCQKGGLLLFLSYWKEEKALGGLHCGGRSSLCMKGFDCNIYFLHKWFHDWVFTRQIWHFWVIFGERV